MPPKKPQRKGKKAQSSSNAHQAELAKITRALANLNKPKSNVTNLGRVLLDGGNALGSLVGFPKIFGSGSYSMKNSLWNASTQVPAVHSTDESIRFHHREYIGDVSMTGPAFSSKTYNVNPGLPATFPYLSSVAGCFQEYSFKGIIFEFKTTSAASITSGTNTAMGSVMMAAQYRSDAPPFTNKLSLLNEMWSVDTVPSASVMLPIECAPVESVMDKQYVRSGPVTGDIKMFDLCSVTVATQGGQSGQNNIVGELWVSYDVELKKPSLSGSVGASGFDLFVSSASGTPSFPFTGMLPSVSNTIGGSIVNNNSYAFPQGAGGYYSIYILFTGTSVTCSLPPLTYNNCRVISNLPASAPGNGVANGQAAIQVIVCISNASNVTASVALGTGTFPNATIRMDIAALPFLPLVFN